MTRSLAMAIALASAALGSTVAGVKRTAADRTLPMRFDLRLQGPAASLRRQVPSSGFRRAAPSPRRRRATSNCSRKAHDLTGATVVLDSDGGSVLGAIALGRDIRRFGLDTTVGRVVDLDSPDQDAPRGKFVPRADCESMCGFVLLGGVHRTVPSEARVMVHQIWLGDRRDDPTAANYSAEDLVLVQRDIGRLAQYTIDMGGSIDLLNLALRIPPWEPMHALTADETRRTRLATDEPRRKRRSGGHGRRVSGAVVDPAGRARDRRRARDRDQRAALGHGRSRRRRGPGAAPAAHRRRRGHRQLRSHARLRRQRRQLRRELRRAAP